MSKRIVLLSDGTWNDGDKSKTNIHWLNENLLSDTNTQLVIYDAGVGTNWYNKKSGGATGMGLSRNVRQIYAQLLSKYQPGDEVYCFGFSRGSYTVRSLCGFAQLVGQLKSSDNIAQAYAYYRIHEPGEEDNFFEKLFRQESLGPIYFRFLGVFDTVGSLGVPFEIENDFDVPDGSLFKRARAKLVNWADRVGDRMRRPITGFHDTSLGNHVEEACHALAIDEHRALFVPTLWTNKPDTALKSDGQAVQQKIEQVWFPGAHSNVGGGYESMSDNERLSDVPLYWMVQKAIAAGLEFEPGAVAKLKDRVAGLSLAPQHDSMTEGWKKLHSALKKKQVTRPIGNESRQETGTSLPVHNYEMIHHSLRGRVGNTVEIVSSDGESRSKVLYTPENLVPSIIQADS